MQVPVVTNVTTPPLVTVQTEVVPLVKVTDEEEVVVAVTVKELVVVCVAGALKVIVCVAPVIAAQFNPTASVMPPVRKWRPTATVFVGQLMVW